MWPVKLQQMLFNSWIQHSADVPHPHPPFPVWAGDANWNWNWIYYFIFHSASWASFQTPPRNPKLDTHNLLDLTFIFMITWNLHEIYMMFGKCWKLGRIDEMMNEERWQRAAHIYRRKGTIICESLKSFGPKYKTGVKSFEIRKFQIFHLNWRRKKLTREL